MSALFYPFRALGYITENLPFAVQRRGSESFVTVSVGKAWQVYKCARLALALVGPELPGNILALASYKDFTFAGVRGTIYECERVHRSGEYKYHTAEIIQLLVLGDLLLSLGGDKRLAVWKIGDYDEPEKVIELGEDFVPSCMAHPDAYLNKVVVGSMSGQLQLWNFMSGQLLYTFNIADSAVRCIVSSPALDVVGIGLLDGRAVLHNLKYDEQVASFGNASGVGAKVALLLDRNASRSPGGGACTTISFRTGAGVPLMAAGGGAGAITVWNLEEKRIHTIIRNAHDGRLLSLHFFPGEPRLMSSAADNSIKQWVFDSADGAARLLRFRSGHSGPPTVLRHYGDGTRLLSAGQDRAFRMFSVIQDQQSRELSQGHIAKRAKKLKVEQTDLKLPLVIAMDACQVRERDWANVITAHSGDCAAYTWRLQNFTLGEHILKPSAKKGQEATPSPVTAVALSACGNFGFVGTASGRIDRYNMQSGIHRGAYSRAASGEAPRPAHEGTVLGLGPDCSNRSLVSAGYDGWLRVWQFKKQTLLREIDVGQSITRMASHPSTALVATASNDLVLRMFDVETAKQVRVFSGHKDRITDLAISNDGRWLLSSSMDGTLRVWDIPAARVLQVVVLGSPITSLSLAPGQELLATTHVNKKGIYLWANQYIFGNGAEILPSDTPVQARLPTISAEDVDIREPSSGEMESDLDVSDDEEAQPHSMASVPDADARQAGGNAGETGPAADRYLERHKSGAPKPLAPDLVTLSMLPRSQWHNLVHLDAIKERSKPVQPPTKPEAAPFFLPTVATLERNPVFDVKASPSDGKAAPEKLPGWGTEDDAEGAGEGEKLGEKRRKSSKSKDIVVDVVGNTKKKSRVLRNVTAVAAESDFIRQLREGAQAGDFSELLQLLRGMSPIAVDRELQSMRVVGDADAESDEVADLDRLMHFVESEVDAGQSFEHVQALLRAVLLIHGEVICDVESLRERAERLQAKLSISWSRLNAKLMNTRCLVNFLGSLSS